MPIKPVQLLRSTYAAESKDIVEHCFDLSLQDMWRDDLKNEGVSVTRGYSEDDLLTMLQDQLQRIVV